MKKVSKLVALSILASVLMSSTTAWGASLSSDSVKGSNNQILTDVTTVAGIGDFSAENGAALSSTFRSPSGIAILPNDSLLVVDTRNHLLRLVKDNQVSTYAGLSLKKDSKGFPIGGRYDGIKEESFFQNPAGLTVDSQGNVFVADAGNNAIRKITPSGQVITLAGNGLIGMKDATGMEATFYNPSDVAVAADGTIYVADTLNHLIRSISPSGQVKTLNALSGRLIEVTPGQVIQSGDYADGILASAKFNEPKGLALDSKGNLYVSDTGNQRIRYIDLQKNTVSTVAGSSLNDTKTGLYGKSDLYAAGDFADGSADKALFNSPQGIAVTDEGGLLIADSNNHSIRYLLNGQVSTIAGAANLRGGEADGADRSAQLRNPSDVAVSKDGSIFVADASNNKLRKISLYRLPTNLPKNDEVKVVYGSQLIKFDVKPEIKEGRTMVPIRAITEALGYQVTFNDAERSVQLSKDGVAIELYIDETGIKRTVQGNDAVMKETDVAPYIKEDTTYVPVRFFAEQIGLNVQWSDAARTAILR
ncbi:copper amine oxidase [Paenibacillus sp. LMG 31456]|uniref:Copper amine oxidase n=1 Tax=Paenibacillus foliorum TaxID=2654974 RepID=A0A972GVZ3_9BACL|nr:stalk domain-containing protein [Paenibacillus foliorum]NOU97924.1 copper amine oxidase [Paenibacillus foliorum]